MIKIIHISDTHLRDFNPEEGDILVHSGDALSSGSFMELTKFREQLNLIKDKYKHIIFVPGNHDWIFQDDPSLCETFLKEKINNIHILHNKLIQLDGLKIYGTADQPIFFDWAFNKTTTQLKQSYDNIPKDTEILITHCPGFGTLDFVKNNWNPNGSNVGSNELTDTINSLSNLKAHLCGHIHFSNGQTQKNGVVYSNGAMCDELYLPTNKEQIIFL